MPKLTLRDLCCSYGDVAVVDNINVELQDREFVSLLGPSGCGKTTTLRMIAGFIDPTGGSITSDDVVLSAPGAVVPPERRGISMIFQSYAVWPHMTVAENVGFGLKLRKLPREDIAKRVDMMLKTVRLSHLADRYSSELSGGQQQRVALARALVVEPKILLLDEPLSNLDVHLRDELRQEIRRLHNEFGTTTVYVTHDQAEAMATSDRIAVMNNGRIEQIDQPYELYMKPRTRFVAEFIGRTNLISGRREGDIIQCDGLSLPASVSENTSANLTFSVRPQAILPMQAARATDDVVAMKVVVEDRVFFGDHWEYVLAPNASQLKLRASMPPAEVFAIGKEIDVAIPHFAFTNLAD